MRQRNKVLVVGVSMLALGAGGAVIAGAAGGDGEGSHPLTGKALEKASAAALGASGGGTVSETEVGDEESYYEVEVTRPDGGQEDVQLNRDFKVVGQTADKESQGNSSR
jgi:hypothetical protein